MKAETKKDAQDELMHGMQVAITEAEGELKEAMIAQFRRVEKFFGYNPGSWNEGV